MNMNIYIYIYILYISLLGYDRDDMIICMIHPYPSDTMHISVKKMDGGLYGIIMYPELDK